MAKKKQNRALSGSASSGPPIARANLNREVIVSPDFVTLYANDTQMQVTPWDVRLIFGQISDIPTKENPTAVIKRVGEVRMSPQHAKTVVRILSAQLDSYEQNIGPIPQPKD